VLAEAPVNVPDTPAGLGAAVVAAGVALGVVVVVVVLVVFLVVVVVLVVAFLVAAGVGVAAGVEVVPVDPLASDVVPPESEVPVLSDKPLVDPNCGGVIDKTAPRPPTVPPAIKKKRFVIIIFS